MHVLLLILGLVAIAAGVVLFVRNLIRSSDKPPATPPDPRPPAVNVFWPDNVDHLLDDVAADLAPELDLGAVELACGHCTHVTTAGSTLDAIAADQAHFRGAHALRLALESAS